MADRNEEEIYSVMFKSLKHPVRRQILKILNNKPLPFMELVALLGVSSSHLTYHLDNLRELVTKNETGEYCLSSFGKATVSAMRGVQEAPELANRRPKKLTRKWEAVFGVLMVAVLLLSGFGVYQYVTITALAANQAKLEAENQQLLSWGIGAGTVADMLRNVVGLDTNNYKITLQSNTLEYREDFDMAEEVLRYGFSGVDGAFNVSLRFRENHLSRYQLTDASAVPLTTQTLSGSNLETAKATLKRYAEYSGDGYLTGMEQLLNQVNTTEGTVATLGNLKLQITSIGPSIEYLWMYTENGVDFSAKSLRMIFNNGVLTALTDGYFLFTIGNTNLKINSTQAEATAKTYLKDMSWTINGTQITGFSVQRTISSELLPHPRGGSVALVPYWYVVLELDQTYAGGFSRASVGVWADTGEVADVQLLTG